MYHLPPSPHGRRGRFERQFRSPCPAVLSPQDRDRRGSSFAGGHRSRDL